MNETASEWPDPTHPAVAWRHPCFEAAPNLLSTITCPNCGRHAREVMPTDACQYLYDCQGCGAVLKPRPGDCCVYCSYGDFACPPVQESKACRG